MVIVAAGRQKTSGEEPSGYVAALSPSVHPHRIEIVPVWPGKSAILNRDSRKKLGITQRCRHRAVVLGDILGEIKFSDQPVPKADCQPEIARHFQIGDFTVSKAGYCTGGYITHINLFKGDNGSWIFASPTPIPACLQFRLILSRPVSNKLHLHQWQIARFNRSIEPQFSFVHAIVSMEMRRVVISEIHLNLDSVKSAQCWHPRIISPVLAFRKPVLQSVSPLPWWPPLRPHDRSPPTPERLL